jgi:glutamate-5-semialdehyde dehydrogenase
MATASPTTDITAIEPMLQSARQSAYALAVATTEQKNQALMAFAALIESNVEALLAANHQDLAAAQQDGTSAALVQRLGLNASKIQQLVQGIRDVARLSDPIGTTLLKTQLDDGLVLSKVAVPLGVIGIIFESRPDVIPQVLSLILKSGNAVVLKGGKEATHSNRAFMALVQQLNQQCPWLPSGWAQLLDSREAAMAILKYPQYVDLIIPRGSNQLVQAIMAGTSIPVLGHADGICHLYVHPSADLVQALPLILDAKTQYPAACNALETVLVDTQIAHEFLPTLAHACQAAGVTLKGCPRQPTNRQ